MKGPSTKNTGTLAKFILRRDRIRIALWLIGIILFTLVIPIAFDGMYASQDERDTMAETMRNPAMTAMVGPGDLENYTTGAMTAHNMVLMTAVVVGLMSVLLVSRQTRADEEDGRIELIRALPVGRMSNLNASLSVLTGTNLVLALLTGIGLYTLGIDSMNLEGSLLYGSVLGGTGIFFAGVTAVFAQLSESSRGTVGFSIAFLLIAYLVRAVGDVSNEAFSMLSPLGWVSRTEIYSANNWWPIVLLIGAAVLMFIFANYLNAIRDLGSGLIQAKPGRKNASALLQHPIGLAFRLQRTATISWAVGMLVIGGSYGAVMGDLESFFSGNEMLEQMLVAEEGYTLTEQFVPMLILVMVLLATVPPLMAMNKLISEEKKERVEALFSRPLSRYKLIASYLVIAMLNGFIMISLLAIGFWSAAETVMDEGFAFGTIYGASMAYYPAMLLMIGISVLLIGILPKLTGLVWLYLTYSFFVLYLGGLFQFPEWLGKLTPFGHVPQVPIESIEWGPVILLTIIAGILMAAGFTGYRRRDIEG